MIDPNRWFGNLLGLDQDPETEDPVTKTLATLGQGLSSAGAAVGQAAQGAGDAAVAAGTQARGWLDDAIAGAPTLLPTPPATQPSYAPRRLEPGEPSMLEQLPAVGAEYVRGASEALGDRGALLAGMRPPETPEEVVAANAPAPFRATGIASEVGGAALEAGLGAFGERAAGTGPSFVTNEIQTPFGTIPSFEGPTPRQIGGAIGRVVGDPTNLILPGTAADRAAGVAVENLAGAGYRAVSAPVKRTLGALGDALEGNARNVAAADARMAAEGGTSLPGTLGAGPEHVYSPTPTEGTARRYHGTAGAFDAADPAKFDENGLYGPGYYTTSDPRVASGYGTERAKHAEFLADEIADAERQIAYHREQMAKPPEQRMVRSPGYYEGKIAEHEARIADLGAELPTAGPNVRAVDIPPDVRLLDADAPLTRETLDQLAPWVERARDVNRDIGDELNEVVDRLHLSLDEGRPVTNDAMLTELMDAGQRALGLGPDGEGRGVMTALMERLGYDGIAHQGGLRVPMRDAAGNPIEHDVSVIFPGSVNKVRNAFSGTYGGSGLIARHGADLGNAAQGAVLGAASEDLQAQQEGRDADPNARLVRGAIGAGLGYVAGRGAHTRGEALGSGFVPAGGAPSGIGQRISAAYQQHKAANVAKMQAAGITPASPLQLAAQVPGAISHAALLGPGTATIGMMSGLIDAAKAPLKEPLRAGVRAVQTGNPAAWREAGETFKGAAAAFYGHEHVGQQLWDLIRGRGRYASSADRPRLAEQISEPILRKLVGALEVPGRVWSGAPDALFGTIGRKGAQFREAAQMATDKGLQGAAWDAEVRRVLGEYEQAKTGGTALTAEGTRLEGVGDRASERAGYQEQLGRVGKVGRQIATLGDAPVIGQFVSPYYNTPWNQFIRAGENLPTGALMGRAGDPRLPSSAPGGGGRHAFDRYVDATLGSALVAGAIGYGMQGKITGSGPEDPDERRMLRATGWRPYSYLAGDTYLPNRSAGQYEPILNAIGESADWMTYRKKDADPRMVGEDAFRRIGKLLSESPAASGLKTIMDVVDYGPSALAADVATRLTPGAALARSIGQASDPYERTTDRGKGVGFWDEVGQRWQLATGQREGLPIQQDPAGRAVPNPREGIAAFFPQVGTRKDDPLIGAFTEAGLSLSGPPPTVEGVQLTPEQRRRYHALFGEMLEQTAGPLVRSEGWGQIPVAQRKTLLEQMTKIARDTAAARTQGEGGEQYWSDYTKAKLEKAGVAP